MKRIKVTINKPNPLFELWLEEWKKKAISQESDLQHHFTKALNTLRRYPLPLDSGKDCIILKHFGLKLCTMLDKRLEEHKVHQKEMERTNNVCKCDSCCRSEFILSSREKRIEMYEEEIRKYIIRQTEATSKKSSLSSWNFACYAILLTLYNKEGDSSYSELLYESKQLYNTSLKSLDPDICDGKSSISILIASKLIRLKQFPIRCHLTKQGIHLAIKIKQIFNLKNYNKHLLQLYFKKLKNSLPTQNYDYVTDKINVKAGSIPKFSNEKYITENEENKQNSPLFNYLKTSDQQNTIKLSSNVVDIMLNGTQDEIKLRPNSFDIVLLVDTKETCGGKTKPQYDATLIELKQLGILFEIRHLRIGDFTWIAKCKYTKKELVLPYIVERKRLDDLSASIKDGRFHEQKFRLKQSGIQNLLYIVEDHDKIIRTGIPLSTLLQASVNSLVQDNFIVKYTDSHQDSMSYLATLTSILCKLYAKKYLIECKKENLLPIDISSNSILVMKFEEFNKAASKLKNFNVRQMFIRQLLQLKGMSVDKALAIVECYPTPLILINALHKSNCGQTLIANIQYGQQKRQIGPAISKTVYLFYTQQELK
ncbi:crossover junction endonuclease MUS81 isoform X1 [Vespa crabro]|uniref:crossover junction endonuclease MUS81 isoform X1 n=1 Tax=Vespa crabro TaxID=7445 RepID=UPI001F019CC8|nr:crossover junction endonuclease MUS81 isoform X1 [Vespa crabro]